MLERTPSLVATEMGVVLWTEKAGSGLGTKAVELHRAGSWVRGWDWSPWYFAHPHTETV